MVAPDSGNSRPEIRILVATDLTDLQPLCKEVSLQAQAMECRVWLLHVIPPESYSIDETGPYHASIRDAAFQDAQRVLAKAALQLHKRKIACDCEVRRSSILDGIASQIQEKQIDRVVQGTSAKGRFGRFFLGSIAESLIHTLEIPVCTLGPNYRGTQRNGLSPILVGSSLENSSDTRAQLELALQLTHNTPTEIAMLHVISADRANKTEVCAEQAIAHMSSVADQVDAKCHIFVRFGNPIEELLREVNELSPKAIVLGARSTGEKTLSLRSGLVHQMIASASCPVFTQRGQ